MVPLYTTQSQSSMTLIGLHGHKSMQTIYTHPAFPAAVAPFEDPAPAVLMLHLSVKATFESVLVPVSVAPSPLDAAPEIPCEPLTTAGDVLSAPVLPAVKVPEPVLVSVL